MSDTELARNLAMLVRRMARRLAKGGDGDKELARAALDFLARNGPRGSPLRGRDAEGEGGDE